MRLDEHGAIFGMSLRSTFLIAALLAAGLSNAPAARACTCWEPRLVQRYEAAKILMLVKVGRNAAEGDHHAESHAWAFEIIDVYKGVPSFSRLVPDGQGCGLGLVTGVSFLVATDEYGGTNDCITLRADRYGSPYTSTVIDILRAYESGEISELTEPWTFGETDGYCRLVHPMTSAGGSLHFYYRFRKPEYVETTQYSYPTLAPSWLIDFTPAIEGQGAHPSTVPGFMNLRVEFPSGAYVAEHSGRVTIGANEWRTARTLMDHPTRPYEVVDEGGAREILAALADASSISIRWTWWGLPSRERSASADYPDGSSRTDVLYFGDALENFQECVARGVLKE